MTSMHGESSTASRDKRMSMVIEGLCIGVCACVFAFVVLLNPLFSLEVLKDYGTYTIYGILAIGVAVMISVLFVGTGKHIRFRIRRPVLFVLVTLLCAGMLLSDLLVPKHYDKYLGVSYQRKKKSLNYLTYYMWRGQKYWV